MDRRILLVGNDRTLLTTRASIVNTRWSAENTFPKDVLSVLGQKDFNLVILCHSLEPKESESLIRLVKENFPEIRILALEKSRGTASHLEVDATAVSVEGPTEMFTQIEALLDEENPRFS
jgi:hypothetical protein